MTSKLIVNSLAADTGVSTITFADQAKMGNSLFHSTGFTIGDSFLHSTGVNLTNINATGVITATKFVGEVSVGRSITFENNEKAYFGTDTDFSIYHNGSASYLDETGTGGLIVKTNTAFQVFNSAGSQPAFTVTPGGSVDLYHNTTKVLETKAYGIDITGGFVATGDCSIADKITHSGDLNTAIRFPANDTFTVETASSERLRIEPGGDVGIGTDNPHKRLHVADYGTHGAIRVEGSGNGNRSGIEFYRETSAGVSKGGAAIWVESDTSSSHGKLRFGTASNASVQSQDTDMILDNNGRLGISSVTPSSPLEIHTNASAAWKFRINTSVSDGAGFYQRANGDFEMVLRDASNNNNYIVGTSGSLEFATSGSKRLQINSNGRLDIASNNYTSGHADTKLRVGTESGSSQATAVIGTADQDVPALIITNWDGSATTNKNVIRFDNSGRGTYEIGGVGGSNTFGIFIDSFTTPKFTINSAGNASITDGNLAFASGHGIDFSATGDASSSESTTSMSNELFDDYEVGSWQPTWSPASGSIGYIARHGDYVKIGRTVHCMFAISANGSTSPTGELKITGLPFSATIPNANGPRGGGGVVFPGAGMEGTISKVVASGTTLRIQLTDGSFLQTGNSNISYGYNAAQISGMFSYITAS